MTKCQEEGQRQLSLPTFCQDMCRGRLPVNWESPQLEKTARKLKLKSRVKFVWLGQQKQPSSQDTHHWLSDPVRYYRSTCIIPCLSHIECIMTHTHLKSEHFIYLFIFNTYNLLPSFHNLGCSWIRLLTSTFKVLQSIPHASHQLYLWPQVHRLECKGTDTREQPSASLPIFFLDRCLTIQIIII